MKFLYQTQIYQLKNKKKIANQPFFPLGCICSSSGFTCIRIALRIEGSWNKLHGSTTAKRSCGEISLKRTHFKISSISFLLCLLCSFHCSTARNTDTSGAMKVSREMTSLRLSSGSDRKELLFSTRSAFPSTNFRHFSCNCGRWHMSACTKTSRTLVSPMCLDSCSPRASFRRTKL